MRHNIGQKHKTEILCHVEETVESNAELVEESTTFHGKCIVVVVVHHGDHKPWSTVQCDGHAPDVTLWGAT